MTREDIVDQFAHEAPAVAMGERDVCILHTGVHCDMCSILGTRTAAGIDPDHCILPVAAIDLKLQVFASLQQQGMCFVDLDVK